MKRFHKQLVSLKASEKGMLLKDVADKMAKTDKTVTPSKLSKMLNGRVTVSNLEKIATAIGCDPTDFFN